MAGRQSVVATAVLRKERVSERERVHHSVVLYHHDESNLHTLQIIVVAV